MDKFWSLLEESVLLQAIMALGLLVTILYLYVSNRDVPAELINFMSLILGFYFGSKVENKRVISALGRKGK